MAYQKQITAGRGSYIYTEWGIAKPVALFHHLHQIVHSSWQSSPDISLKDCFRYGKFWGVESPGFPKTICCWCLWISHLGLPLTHTFTLTRFSFRVVSAKMMMKTAAAATTTATSLFHVSWTWSWHFVILQNACTTKTFFCDCGLQGLNWKRLVSVCMDQKLDVQFAGSPACVKLQKCIACQCDCVRACVQ